MTSTDDTPAASARTAVTALRPAAAQIEQYRARGLWRRESAVDDLAHWSTHTPDAPAIIAHEARGGVRRLTYRELAGHVDRFAAALRDLGAGPGQVVALQLPNRWQVNALLLACARIGALAAPIMPTIRPRELERVLRRLGARVCVTVDSWDGFDHADGLAEIAPRLPELRHRVILGERVAADEIDFHAVFEAPDRDHFDRDLAGLGGAADPDRVGFVLFTSGTSGEPRAALHTLNTLHAIHAPVLADLHAGPHAVFFTPHASTHAAGINLAVLAPVLTGGVSVLTDAWDPDTAADFLAEAGVTFLVGAPVFLSGLLDALERRSARLPAITAVTATATAVHTEIVDRVAAGFGVSLGSIWSMTEGGSLLVSPDDPPGWAGRSIGRPAAGTDVRLHAGDPVTEEQPARLAIRGPAVCLGLLGRDNGGLTVLAEHDEGWLDTGDLAVPDGRGGVRLLGRAADRIGGVFMIPATDVESALLGHADVRDVAIVGYPDGPDAELACAVVVSDATPPPSLAALRQHLRELGMTGWYLPSRLELVPALPRNATGKVRKELLRRWLLGTADLPEAAPTNAAR